MSIKDTVRNWIVNLLDLNSLEDAATRARIEHLAELRDYYEGTHKQQLKVKAGKFNDNLSINLVGLIIDKAVSALVGDPADGHGMTWTFPSETGDETPKSITWLDEQWEANHRELFLHKNALIGAESGIPAIKIVPDGEGNIKLVNINPLLFEISTDPQDIETVTKYTIRYIVMEDDREVAYREVTSPNGSGWIVETQKQTNRERWIDVNPPVAWNYDFPPILSWQNLPVTDSPYGRSDISSIIPIQDRYNFLISNLCKRERLLGFPQRYGKNLSAQIENGEFKMGPDEMPMYSGDGSIEQLEAYGQTSDSMVLIQHMQELAFRISREIDVALLQRANGDLSNYRMTIMCREFLDKLGTKRMLYGSAYQELNRRLLILGGYEPETCVINWPDPLPVNEVEEITALKADMEMQLVSKQTAREMRGYDPKQEDERMGNEKMAGDNAGAMLLNNFFAKGVNAGQ